MEKHTLKMASFLEKPDYSIAPAGYPPEDMAIHFPYKLDVWQQYAVMAVHKAHNILVTASTGSGKTTVAEYQIAYCLAKGQRVFYTTPIKSLSNQKFHDLKHLFPKNSVGIMTGDIKCNPEADIVIMTAEILRNLLYKRSTVTANIGTAGQLTLERVGAIVVDEMHYVNDPDRGHVWEETFILLPPEIRMVLLSATIDAPAEFAAWLGVAKQHPIVLLQTKHRIVPLVHGIYDPIQKPLPLRVLKAGDEAPFNAAEYTGWLRDREHHAKAADDWKDRVRAAGASGGSIAGAQGKVKVQSFQHTLNQCIDTLKERTLLPALFFQFSRKACESYAAQCTHTLIDASDAAALKHIVNFHLHRYADTLHTLPQYHQLMPFLERGIAFHHSGLLPLLKEIVELLFSRGYIKVLFCTETFAVGLNMPARSVVFCDLKKPAEGGHFRPLRPDEYIQMAGRAGRRGKDTQGTVLYLPARNPVAPDELRYTLSGALQPVQSRLQFHYDFLLKALLQTGAVPVWQTLTDASYLRAQQAASAAVAARDLAAARAAQEAVPLALADRDECAQKRVLETQVKSATNAARRKAQAELDKWRERHAGPKWIAALKQFQEWQAYEQTIAEHEKTLAYLETDHTKERVEPVIAALHEWAAITHDNTLTPFGLAASEINEANPLLVATLYDSKLLHTATATAADIVITLAALVVDREAEEKTRHPRGIKTISETALHALLALNDWATDGIQRDTKHGVRSPDDFWKLTTLWVEIAADWLAGQSAAEIAIRYELFEGNLMKGILKLIAILHEWIAVATLRADVEMLEKLKNTPQEMARDIARSESLYLHL